MLLTTGLLADFKTGYLRVAQVEHQCEVVDGTDNGSGGTATASTSTGFAVGRLVTLTRHTDGTCHIEIVTDASATSIGSATHIVAQADDSLDTKTIRGEALNFAPTGLLKNTATGGHPTAATATMKRVALYPVVNLDDVKIFEVKPATVSVVR